MNITSKVAAAALSAALAVGGLVGCASQQSAEQEKQVSLDPNNPVALTVWHYYNGAQQASFDSLVSEFNESVGKEKGIYVEAYSQGSVSDLEKAVTASAAGEVGSDPLPDIFSTYSDTAYTVEKQGKLADISQYFTSDELDQYVDAYINEGDFNDDGTLYFLPVAKSTEVTMLNDSDEWKAFCAATGASASDLSTQEGIVKVAKEYYEYTDALTPDVPNDGKAFYGRDSMSNYFVIGMKQMGVDLFQVSNGEVTLNVDKDKIRRLWDNYYVPYVSGYFDSVGKFRSEDVKTGDILVYTGSTASAAYFPDAVVTDSSSEATNCVVLPSPVMEGGQKVNPQQGAGMAVTKSDDAHEYAACEFLKWFTEKENNLRFTAESSYMPVKKDANTSAALEQVVSDADLSVNDKVMQTMEVVLDNFDNTDFYASKCFDNAYSTRKVLDYAMSDQAVADKAAVAQAIAGGATRDEALAPYLTDQAFDAWYDALVAKLNAAAYGN